MTTNRRQTYAGAVKLRDRQLASGCRSLYLDMITNGERNYEFLRLYLTGDKTHDRNVRALGRLLGHAGVALTQVYARVIDRKLDDAINLLPSL